MNINDLQQSDLRTANLIPISDTTGPAGKMKKTEKPAKNGKKSQSQWCKTQYAGLVRYVSSKVLFARIKVNGKLIRQSLETTDVAVAKRKLEELRQQAVRSVNDARDGKLTFADALIELKERGFRVRTGGGRNRRPLKPRTKAYYEERLKALALSWPELASMQLRKVTAAQCQGWADRVAHEICPSAYNHTISLLRQVFQIAVEKGARYDNPAAGLGRMPERRKRLELPGPEKFTEFVHAIETGGSGFSKPCADLVRFLAYGGFRKGEAANVLWKDCDFKNGLVHVWGDPETRTKNGEVRHVPMIPEMKLLLQRLRDENPDGAPESPVMAVRECQKAMDRAAKIVGIARMTHHQLRHLFITRCLECQVDVKTVAEWAGHKDGGALLLKTYAHLRSQHSRQVAQQVSFSTDKNEAA